jgi:fatty-acyl-CoA synthase
MATGDMGHIDAEGRLFVDGRDDDMIVSGGENVFPSEIEDLLAGVAGVAEVAVTGVADPEFGQRLRAYVVPVSGAELDEHELKTFVRDRLARYKVPREIVFVAALPRNATGKILKREL